MTFDRSRLQRLSAWRPVVFLCLAAWAFTGCSRERGVPLIESQPTVITSNAVVQSWTASLLTGIDRPQLLLDRDIDDALNAEHLPANNPIPAATRLVVADGVLDSRAVEAFVRFEGEGPRTVVKASDQELDGLVWLDPNRSGELVESLAGKLAPLYPDGGTAIASNQAALLQSLSDISARIARDLAPWKGETLICTRADMRPWFDATGLKAIFVEDDPARSDDNESFRTDLRRAAETVRLRVVVTGSRQQNPLLSAQAAELGLRVVSLDTFEAGAMNGNHYADRMRHNAFILAFALSVADDAPEPE